MKKFRWLPLFCFFLSCAAIPTLQPLVPIPENRLIETCASPFLTHTRRFVHSIEASLPGSQKGYMIGISIISPETRRIESVIMTLEGFVLFDATYDNDALTIHRAVPPFNGESFARGLMNDIRLIFIEPDGERIDVGIANDGLRVCRYYIENESIIDVMPGADNSAYQICRYDSAHHQVRRVWVYPEKIRLSAMGNESYQLDLELIESDRVRD